MQRYLVGLVAGLAAGCVSVPPMSAAAHDDAAARESATAQADRAQYAPDELQRTVHCDPNGAGSVGDLQQETPPPCWTELTNPTSHFVAEARQLDRIAGAHRSASQALRDTEARACVGVEERDRHVSPFAHPEDLARITVDSDPAGGPLGATVEFRAVPGLTVQVLQRVINCHLAIDAELGNDVPERLDCPLVPRGVRAEVHQEGSHVRVILRGASPAVAAEIIRRVRLLPTPTPQVRQAGDPLPSP